MIESEEKVFDLGDLFVAGKYLFATIFCAAFGSIYEHFSFGVYSGFMAYAFGFPLVLGVLPFYMHGMRKSKGLEKFKTSKRDMDREMPGEWSENQKYGKVGNNRWAENCWHAGVATLTVGSLVKGVLDIYGTDSPYVIWYWIMGVGLLVVAAADAVIAKFGKA